MFGLWIPLAASMLIMVLETSIVNIGLGRSADAELALAAYGVAYSIALLVEAPILMLIDASWRALWTARPLPWSAGSQSSSASW